MTPDEQLLASWLLTKPGLTYRTTVEAMNKERPSWIVSEKRLRKLRKQTRDRLPTIVTLDANSVPCDRDALLKELVPYIPSRQLPTQANVIPTVDEIASILGTAEVNRIGRFYERDADTLMWYYEVYAAGVPAEGQQPNSVAQIFASLDTTVGGTVVFVKNGALEGNWAPDIDRYGLAKDIWWYMRSGIRPGEVTAARELERFIANNM